MEVQILTKTEEYTPTLMVVMLEYKGDSKSAKADWAKMYLKHMIKCVDAGCRIMLPKHNEMTYIALRYLRRDYNCKVTNEGHYCVPKRVNISTTSTNRLGRLIAHLIAEEYLESKDIKLAVACALNKNNLRGLIETYGGKEFIKQCISYKKGKSQTGLIPILLSQL
jgi:hypothetical protein